jgi:hypothetical protein
MPGVKGSNLSLTLAGRKASKKNFLKISFAVIKAQICKKRHIHLQYELNDSIGVEF